MVKTELHLLFFPTCCYTSLIVVPRCSDCEQPNLTSRRPTARVLALMYQNEHPRKKNTSRSQKKTKMCSAATTAAPVVLGFGAGNMVYAMRSGGNFASSAPYQKKLRICVMCDTSSMAVRKLHLKALLPSPRFSYLPVS